MPLWLAGGPDAARAAQAVRRLPERRGGVRHPCWPRAKASNPSSMSSAIRRWASARIRASSATSTAWPSWRRPWASIPETGTTTYRPNYTPVCSAPSPDASWASSSIRCARPACTNGTPGAARCSRTWATGSGPGTTRGGGRPARRRAPRVPGGVQRRRHPGCLHAGQDRYPGPDAVALLNWMYTNPWGKLEIGKCRYGLMLDENGMVFDDGVTTRLGEHHFMMTTTTGGAARVLSWMERWLQTEWPQLKVRLASVTDHWATFAVAGPKAARCCARSAATSISNEAFPLHELSGRPGRRRSGARDADQLFRRARLRGERTRERRPRGLGGPDGGGRGIRHHAVRHRDHARAARGEGLHHRRAGHRRLGHAAGPGHGRPGGQDQGLPGQALAGALGYGRRGASSSWAS